jgi:tetratricopeptide (TPR) repeat protein
MWASYGLGLLSLRQGTLPRAIPLLERAMSICVEAELPLFVPRVAAALGSAYILDGRSAEALPLLTQAMNQTTAQDLAGFEALCSLPLAAAYLGDGRLEEALAVGERALTLARKHQEQGNQAYALHLLGDLAAHAQSLHAPVAEAHYQEALALAERLGMRPLQAHCHLSLGLLYLQHDKTHQARPELSAASNLYRDMDMTLWLPQVGSALAQLEGRTTA